MLDKQKQRIKTRTSVLVALLLLGFLIHNVVSIFYINIPFLYPETPIFSQENRTKISSPKPLNSSSTTMYVIREHNSRKFIKSQHISHIIKATRNMKISSSLPRPRRNLGSLNSSELENPEFSTRMSEFFESGDCQEPRFFMTWISPIDSFGEREVFAVESLFKTNPKSCLAIVSRSLDSKQGRAIFKPFRDLGFRVTAIAPDYGFIFENTPAEAWFQKLLEGKIKPGLISMGQNLSNVVRLCLLYKFGGVYSDTDVIFLRSFSKLRNAIGAQSVHGDTRKWSRLNNAVLVFDKSNPLLLEFIEEFATTFDGSKWGHNGPYMVSRVVARLEENPGFSLAEILPPSGFYPVDWKKIDGFFRGPEREDEAQKNWRLVKMSQIKENGYAIHLWNRQSKGLVIENGSIIDGMRKSLCVFCDSPNQDQQQ